MHVTYIKPTLRKAKHLGEVNPITIIIKKKREGLNRMVKNYGFIESVDANLVLKGWSIRRYFQPGDIGSLVFLHGTLYAKEYGYDQSFEAYVAKGLAEFVGSFDPKYESVWIVVTTGQIIGCIAVARNSEKEAQLRWFFVHPDFRGSGIGTSLLADAVQFCKDHGYKTVSLWTTSELATAQHLYTQAGFQKREEKTHEIWGKLLTEERYELQF